MEGSAFDKLDEEQQAAVKWRASIIYMKGLGNSEKVAPKNPQLFKGIIRNQEIFTDLIRQEIAENPEEVARVCAIYQDPDQREKMQQNELGSTNLLSALLNRGSGERSR